MPGNMASLQPLPRMLLCADLAERAGHPGTSVYGGLPAGALLPMHLDVARTSTVEALGLGGRKVSAAWRQA